MGFPFFGGGNKGGGVSSGGLEVIEWANPDDKEIIWKWPNDRIRWGSTVVVRAGQAAVFLRDGKIMGVLQEGRHVLTTVNIPWLTSLVEKIPGVGKMAEMFIAEIYFISLTEKRGEFGGKAYAGNRFPVMIHGDYRYKIDNPEVFLRELAGASADIDTAYITNYLRQTVMSRLQKFIGDLPPNDFTETLQVQNKAKAFLTTQFEQLGLKLVDLNLTLELTPEFEKLLPYLAGAQTWDQLYRVLQMQTLQQMSQNVGQNPAAGMGVGMGLGMMMPYMMGAQPAAAAPMMAGGYIPPQQQAQPQQPQPQQQMKKCPKCGALVPANAKFCPYCGYKFE